MSEFKADLHCHSIFSDGSLTPFELVSLAKEMGLGGLSITDHDSISAYSEELFAFAKEQGIVLLVGVEISSELFDTGVHILGYGVDYHLESFKEFLFSVQQKRLSRIKQMISKLRAFDIDIDWDKLMAFVKKTSTCHDFSIGRAHLGRYLVEHRYASSMPDAFGKFLKDGACCYVAGEKYSCQEVIEKIHQAKGKAILAHPHLIKKGKTTRKLLQLPFDGLEGYYAKIPNDQEKTWIQKAQEKNWIVTGGSDFHGASKMNITLGCSYVTEEVFKRLSS